MKPLFLQLNRCCQEREGYVREGIVLGWPGSFEPHQMVRLNNDPHKVESSPELLRSPCDGWAISIENAPRLVLMTAAFS